MTLESALFVLTHVHTQDDMRGGFTVHARSGVHDQTRFSPHEYIEAWKVVRKHIGLPTRPSKETE
jgi:hypothetical protein